MNPGPYVKSLVPAVLAVLYSLQSWAATGHMDAPHVRGSLLGLAVAAVIYWLPNTSTPASVGAQSPTPTPPPLDETPTPPPQTANDRQLNRRLAA